MNTNKKTTFDMGTIENVRCAIFASPINPAHSYVVGLEDMDFIEFNKRFPDSKRVTGLCMDDSFSNTFWLIFNADCFDPPMAIVRCDSLQDAIDIYVDELPWSRIEEPDLSDYDPETLSYGENACIPYDSESLQAYEIKLIRVEV